MNRLCTDIAYQSLTKHGEELCGDRVELAEGEDGSSILVLADGLGSGVKANILATLTAKIIATMMARSMSLEACVDAIAATLPVCEVRGIAYSTFTIIRVAGGREAEIIQYDNPPVILLRDGKYLEFEKESRKIGGKLIHRSHIQLQENDVLVAFSDGAVYAGTGESMNFDWQRPDIIRFLEGLYRGEYTAKMLATFLLEQCNLLYDSRPGDDTTVCALKVRRRQSLSLMIGPPADPADEETMLTRFFSDAGRHIVCGGTTSVLAARFLGRELKTDMGGHIDREVPPTARIEGVDLVTEGVITIDRVLLYARDYVAENSCCSQWSRRQDGASQIARMLFEDATDIRFYVGMAVNAAHQDPTLSIGFDIKIQLVEELAGLLRHMGKQVEICRF